MIPAAPTQVLSSRLPAPPEQVWARVRHSGFIADYLGATLPAADWQAGRSLQGTGRDGAPLAIAVIEALAPCSLSLRLSSGNQQLDLRLSIAACTHGSRLTLTHEAAGAASAGAEFGAEPGAESGLRGLARQLAAAPGVASSAGALGSLAAMAAAQAYLADTATLVAALRRALRPQQAYALPADGRFSLAQHVWHLADVEQFGWAQRFERLLAVANPRLPGVDGDRLAIERRYQQRRWQPAAARFARQRQHTLAALARSTPATLQRPVHFSGQHTTGAEMLAALLAHDHEHRLEMSERLADR
jgi:uncharacterized damage-inducible protein DinB